MTILMKLAKAGSAVRKGDIVAEFDRQYQLNRLDDYRASVTQHEASLKRLMAELAVTKEAHNQKIRVAKAELEKAALDLKTAEVRSEIEAEILKLSLEEAQAYYKQLLSEVKHVEIQQQSQLKEAELDLNQAKLELARNEANIERMIVRAPIDGIIVMQTIFRSGEFGQVQEGDMLHPGQIFMQIVDPSSMVLNAKVNQVDAEVLRLSMKAVARFDAYPGLELPAHVVGVGAMTRPGMFRANYMREVPVKMRLEKMDPRVIPDLSASAEVIVETEQQAAIAPRGAIFYAGNSPFVFLRTAGGFERREVELGPSNHTHVAVRSGLSQGAVIALERPPSEEQQ
jgi:multidrug efflux pump subunit AcrA (membrane-fusion protein)